MARRRTTVILDDEADNAARELADYYGCDVPDAIRRSVIAQRDALAAVPTDARKERLETLHRLFDLFEGHDAAAEVRRLKREDQGF